MSLIKTITDFEKYVPISTQLDPDFVKLPPQIEISEQKYIIKEIGKTLYLELVSQYEDEIFENESTKTATFLLQKAIANFTIALFIPKHKVQIDANGVRVTNSDERQDAKPYDTYEAIRSYERDGWIALEEALEFIEINSRDFPTWTASPESTIFSNSFIKTTFDFEAVTGMQISRRLFKKIKPYITTYERDSVKSKTGKELFDELINQMVSNSVTELNKQLIEPIRYVVAHGALARAISMAAVELNDEGLTVAAPTSTTNMVKPRASASDRSMENIVATCNEVFTEQIGILVKTLQDNADDYPLFKDSSAYKAEYNGKTFTNPDDTSVFLL
jgi:chemotaxis protein CheY-P-specific phosphatase CheC